MLGNVTLIDIFTGIDSKKITGTCHIAKTYGVKDNRELCVRIAGRFLDLMITDIVNNKGIFRLSKNGAYYINVRMIDKDVFKKIRDKKTIHSPTNDIDFFKAGFKSYMTTLNYHFKGSPKRINVVLCKKIRKIFHDNINNQMKFNCIDILTYKDYVDKIKEMFDKIDESSIIYILKYTCFSIYRLLQSQTPMHLTYKPIGFSIFLQPKKGRERLDSIEQRARYFKKIDFLEKTGKYNYDGYYYIFLNEDEYDYFIENGITPIVSAYKLKEYLIYNHKNGHILRTKIEKDRKFYRDTYEKSNVEYFSRGNKFRFRPHFGPKQCTD